MTPNKTYIALTTGPIYGTFSQVKRTRAVWASSYLFSWLTKRIVAETKTEGFDIRLPYPEPVQSIHGSGMYADRVYYVGDDTHNKAKLQGIVDTIIKELADDMDEDDFDFLKKYINVHIIETPFKDGDTIDAYPLDRINQMLDHKELQQNYVFEIEDNPLLVYLEQKLNDKNEKGDYYLLKKDAFNNDTDRKFRSISEIATTTLERVDSLNIYRTAVQKTFKKEDLDLIDELKNKGLLILPHLKYYAVIYADGDNIGQVLEASQSNKQDLLEFSNQLFEFAKKAEQTIADYGGNGIYLGGEDILAFAPIACVDKDDTSKTKTIFDLIQGLDADFKATLGTFAASNGVAEPTLSYGIMMSYFKHPLKEAMKYAHELMDYKAKKMPNKNSIGICLQKHSGQRIECVMDKNNSNSYNEITELIASHTSSTLGNNEFLASMMHRLNDEMFFDLYAIAVDADIRAGNTERLDAFFDNFFNEDVHRANDTFLRTLKGFSRKIIIDYNGREDRKNILFTTLRYIHFINSTNDRE